MTTFALVHGACHGGWCWDRLAALLRADGHVVIAPDLPTDDCSAGPSRYAEIVVAAVSGTTNDVVLVGHSMGGLTIPLVAAARPVRHLVFLSAFVPRPGQVPFGSEPDAPPTHDPGLRIQRSGDLFVFPPDVARSYLYNRCSAEAAASMIGRLRPQSFAPHNEICPLRALPRVPSTYIIGTDDRALLPSYGAYLARTRLAAEPLTVDADHSAYLSAPDAVAALLGRL